MKLNDADFCEKAMAYISPATRAAAELVLQAQEGREDMPVDLVKHAAEEFGAPFLPVLILTSGRLPRAVLRGETVEALDDYASFHGKIACALPSDQPEAWAALAVYRTMVRSADRTVLPTGVEITLDRLRM